MKYVNRPGVNRTDIFPTFNIAEGSPYVGSGALDGNGIPLDFFSDLNVRQALATCFNYEVYNEEVLLGQGVRNNGTIIKGMLGYNEDGPMYEYDPEACAGYLEAVSYTHLDVYKRQEVDRDGEGGRHRAAQPGVERAHRRAVDDRRQLRILDAGGVPVLPLSLIHI